MNFQLTDEQRMWRKAVHEFVRSELKPRAREIDETGEIPWDVIKKMGPMGLLGMSVPEKYGGSDLDSISAAIAIEELGWGDGGTALTIEAHNELGCAAVALFGTPEQKQTYLPPAASGEGRLAALALTEPGAGSDLRGIRTRADREKDHFLVNGAKAWITNAADAGFIVTLVLTDPDRPSRGMSLLILPAGTPGLQIAPPEKKMGAGGTHSHEVCLEDVRIPVDHLLGEENRGLQHTLRILDGGRISVGALSVGIAQAAFEEALKYAQAREAFGKPIAAQQAVQWMLADAGTEIHAARLLVYYAAWLKDQGRPFTRAGAMAKVYATEMAERVTRNAIQIHGAYGYSREYPVEGMYRAARLMTIGEGTSEIQRLVIARGLLEKGSLSIP